MSKGLLFWIIWILCLLSFGGVVWFGWPAVYSGGVMLVLFGLLGWHCLEPRFSESRATTALHGRFPRLPRPSALAGWRRGFLR